MKVGTICYATDSGLGILAKSFYDHKVVTDVLVVRHGRHETHDAWYPGSKQVCNLRSESDLQLMELFCETCDVMLFFETPFHWSLIEYCRKRGVKTALMTMYECTPSIIPSWPDLFICPSSLDMGYFQVYNGVESLTGLNGSRRKHRTVQMTVPVEYPWKLRTKAEVFVHNAGHGGLKGRNGTAEVLGAIQYIESDARVLIRSQQPLTVPIRDSRQKVDVVHGTFPYSELYSKGDVFLFPEKFNGLSLPLQEAYAAGMLVMAGSRFPMDTWLPRDPLIPVSGCRKSRIGPPYNEFDEAVYDPKIIAAQIDAWYGADIGPYSAMGKQWADNHSWEKLGSKYTELLRSL